MARRRPITDGEVMTSAVISSDPVTMSSWLGGPNSACYLPSTGCTPLRSGLRNPGIARTCHWLGNHPSLVTSPLPPSLMDCNESISSPGSYSPHRFVTFSRAINELLVLAQPRAITLIATGLLARSTTIAPRPHHDPPRRGARVAPKCALGDRVVNS